jgi:hypothetical protein
VTVTVCTLVERRTGSRWCATCSNDRAAWESHRRCCCCCCLAVRACGGVGMPVWLSLCACPSLCVPVRSLCICLCMSAPLCVSAPLCMSPRVCVCVCVCACLLLLAGRPCPPWSSALAAPSLALAVLHVPLRVPLCCGMWVGDHVVLRAELILWCVGGVDCSCAVRSAAPALGGVSLRHVRSPRSSVCARVHGRCSTVTIRANRPVGAATGTTVPGAVPRSCACSGVTRR